MGIRDSKLKDKLLRDPKLTLDKAVYICKASEAAKEQMNVLNLTVPWKTLP